MNNESKLQKVGAGRTATIYRYNKNQVVKLYRATFPGNAICKEFQIGLTLNQVGLDIPKTYELIELNESKGILLDYIQGVSMLQSLARKPWLVFSYAKKMARLHFKTHDTTVTVEKGIPSLRESLTDKISRVTLLTGHERTAILSHLSTLRDGSSICHGDFHPDNVIISKESLVIVDWITAGIGNPIADVARTWLLLTMGTLPENRTTFEIFLAKRLRAIFCNDYIREYKRLSNFQPEEFEEWKLPVAAARLIENVSDKENQNLVRFIKLRLATRWTISRPGLVKALLNLFYSHKGN